jgi:hypothetical protein
MEVYQILDMSTKNSSANNTLFSKERIETLIGGVKQAKDATKPSTAQLIIKCIKKIKKKKRAKTKTKINKKKYKIDDNKTPG